MKVCKNCGEEKSLDDFYMRSDGGVKKPRSECKKCTAVRVSNRYHSSEDVRTVHRNNSRKNAFKKYGLDETDFDRMFDEQGGKCKICGTEILKVGSSSEIVKIACIDHCHETGKVRGLLCRPCNTGLGNFKDNTSYLLGAIKYLEGTKC